MSNKKCAIQNKVLNLKCKCGIQCNKIVTMNATLTFLIENLILNCKKSYRPTLQIKLHLFFILLRITYDGGSVFLHSGFSCGCWVKGRGQIHGSLEQIIMNECLHYGTGLE